MAGDQRIPTVMPFRILYITTKSTPRTRASELAVSISYNKNDGWQLRDSRGVMVAVADRKTRHPDEGLRLDVDGFVICDSLSLRT